MLCRMPPGRLRSSVGLLLDALQVSHVFASGLEETEAVIQRVPAAGMDDYIAWPVELKVLRGKLARWLPLAVQNTSAR